MRVARGLLRVMNKILHAYLRRKSIHFKLNQLNLFPSFLEVYFYVSRCLKVIEVHIYHIFQKK